MHTMKAIIFGTPATYSCVMYAETILFRVRVYTYLQREKEFL